MKKYFLTSFLCILFVCTCAAQHRIGGDLGFGIYGTKNNSGQRETGILFDIQPRYTYAITDKIEVGASLDIGTSQAITNNQRASNFYWAINPLARFYIVGKDNFGFWIEAKAKLGTSSFGSYWNNSFYDGGINLHYGLNFNPVFTYQLTSHFRMEATLGFLGLGLNAYTHFANNQAQYSTVDFGLHIANGSLTTTIDHLKTIMGTMGGAQQASAENRALIKDVDFQIGFVYTF